MRHATSIACSSGEDTDRVNTWWNWMLTTFPLSLPLNSEWISSRSILHIFNFPACTVDGSWMRVRRLIISTKGGVEIGFTGFVSQFSMVVEANYGGARSEGSWMDTWGVRIWPSHGERKEICWRLSILFLPPLHMHSLYLFIYLFCQDYSRSNFTLFN